jgi:hypothetical protein
MMRAFAVLAALAVSGCALAQSGRSIQWMQDVQEGVSLARKTKRPLAFYVIGRTKDRPNVENEHRRSFQDRTVLRVARYFVTVRLLRSQHLDLIRQWQGVNENANLDIVFTRPDGRELGAISAGGVAQPDSLAQSMYNALTLYRQQLYDEELRARIEDGQTPPAELRDALRLVNELLVLNADQGLARLVQRESLEPGLRKQAYEVLAELSTPTAVQALRERAASDPLAADALGRCTPAAAERLLEDLDSEDAGRHLLAYKAVTKICRIRNVKPDGFWEGANEKLRSDEIQRVRELVSAAAKRWSLENEFR